MTTFVIIVLPSIIYILRCQIKKCERERRFMRKVFDANMLRQHFFIFKVLASKNCSNSEYVTQGKVRALIFCYSLGHLFLDIIMLFHQLTFLTGKLLLGWSTNLYLRSISNIQPFCFLLNTSYDQDCQLASQFRLDLEDYTVLLIVAGLVSYTWFGFAIKPTA